MFCCVVLRCVVLRCVVLYSVVLCCVVLWLVSLRCVVLCCVHRARPPSARALCLLVHTFGLFLGKSGGGEATLGVWHGPKKFMVTYMGGAATWTWMS